MYVITHTRTTTNSCTRIFAMYILRSCQFVNLNASWNQLMLPIAGCSIIIGRNGMKKCTATHHRTHIILTEVEMYRRTYITIKNHIRSRHYTHTRSAIFFCWCGHFCCCFCRFKFYLNIGPTIDVTYEWQHSERYYKMNRIQAERIILSFTYCVHVMSNAASNDDDYSV